MSDSLSQDASTSPPPYVFQENHPNQRRPYYGNYYNSAHLGKRRQASPEEDYETPRKMDCGTCFAKYILCLFNFIFFIAGAVVLAVGIWLYADKDSLLAFTKVIDENHLPKLEQVAVVTYIAYILMVAGACIFILSLIGYCGALRESKCLLGFYGFLLVIILILEITATGLAFVYKERVQTEIKTFLKDTIKDYSSDPAAQGDSKTHLWNQLMTDMSCCGLDNYTDFSDSAAFRQKGDKVPIQCCKMTNGTLLDPDCPRNPKLENSFYLTGCYQVVMNEIKQHLFIVIYVMIAVVIVELFSTFLAFCLCKSLEPYDK